MLRIAELSQRFVDVVHAVQDYNFCAYICRFNNDDFIFQCSQDFPFCRGEIAGRERCGAQMGYWGWGWVGLG